MRKFHTVAHLVRAFGLQDADVKFPNQLTNRALGARQDNPRPPPAPRPIATDAHTTMLFA